MKFSQIHFKKPFAVIFHRKKVISKIRIEKVDNQRLNLRKPKQRLKIPPNMLSLIYNINKSLLVLVFRFFFAIGKHKAIYKANVDLMLPYHLVNFVSRTT